MRHQKGRCIAVNDSYEKKWKQGEIVDKICIYKQGEVFDFLLEDGWLYHLTNNRKRIRVQYAVFDRDFEILKV